MISFIKNFVKKYSHAWVLVYFFIYMAWFTYLENTVTPESDFTNLHIPLDDIIPFNEWFVIPYVLWFFYIPLVIGFVFFTSRKEFYYACAYLFVGMSICLLICTVWPNGQDLRVEEFVNDNMLTKIMQYIYNTDTNTNVFPSIHTFNSVGAFIVICKSHILGKYKSIKIGCGILSVLIIMSTVILKQHSIVDLFGGLVLGIIMYYLVYVIDWKKVFKKDIEKSEV